MNILLIGSGGRENALAWKLAQSSRVKELYIAAGNPGTAEYGENLEFDESNQEALLEFALKEKIDITVVGPEAPLAAGIVDLFEEHDLKVFGPKKAAAQLESSKAFSKKLMEKYSIPTAEYRSFTSADEAKAYIKEKGAPIVVKASGLAAGKGVIVAQTEAEAVKAVETIMLNDKFGEAGEKVVIEEFLEGEEATILAFCDGKTVVPMIPSQDHKPAYDGGKGPNTGGMGAYAPAPVVTEEIMEDFKKEIMEPTLKALQSEGLDFKGIIYFGLMIKNSRAKVLEYNVRFGDPEAQVVLPLLETDLVDIMESVLKEDLDKIEIKWKDKKALCVVMASGGYPVNYEKGKEITGIKEAAAAQDIIVFQAGTRLEGNKLLTDGGRVLAVTALGDSFQEVIDKAYQGVEKIHFEDFQIRKDIGHKALKK
ncbi:MULTISPECIES: phosphoribosylamine--glycine ligase [Halanaerobium]|jgi:phosphoribosylamine--glycine ligase|uniref:Phosphoribosylamine--glycine ligase n=1 Tax=Halanaerobium saccharolyticum TaxID=43595 RepID=A0A4R6RPV9_9FIRM|nr:MULTISPECIES: phosphoribosylamine--glycine ligase [Halanaerobium]OEG63160.1 MAG: phosphoribosylamine--glycine ligase [Halanaerobium sp. MDAL1]PUU94406.1 MAG: phosphoribosylamine--glycine ligase [Halanaerobium sp.]PUU94825.1 MAG: phosphoribosylamine--glycine ligase [Halanaerobium sp.]TDP88730.1 phosphoribosylamine--glycine ligase [Halanaerobium saccharolyticum]